MSLGFSGWLRVGLVGWALPGCTGGRLEDRLEALGGEPCEADSAFWCVTLDVPAEVGGPDTLPFRFAVRPADKKSLGPLVIADGGPGQPGLAGIDDLTWIDDALSERFDLLYFNLRGTGEPDGFYCRDAVNTWVNAPQRVGSADEAAGVAAAAEALSTACLAESGWTGEALASLRTDRAITDLDAARDALDVDQMTLYGLSYGTQFTQEYASAYPEHVRAVVLDGVVDLTIRDLDYATELARETNDVLDGAIAACDDDAVCGLDDLGAAYDAVGARLDGAAAAVASPMPTGALRDRAFTRAQLDTVTLLALDDPYGRAHLLRAVLAAAQRDDFVPLRRLLDNAGGYDPVTERYDSFEYSDAIYYAVTCNDYGRVDGGLPTWLARGEEERAAGQRTNSAFHGDLPCATWPSAGAERARPAPFVIDAPVLVVGATADVATPAPMGWRVLDALRAAGAEARGIRVDGGHHVMWGDSADCADPAINAFVFDPTEEVSSADLECEGGWLAGYAPLGPVSTAALTTARDVADAFVVELLALPWFPWAGDQGCDRGGAVRLDDDYGLRFEACRFFDDLTVDGTGTIDPWEGSLSASLTLSGAHTGTFTYDHDRGGTRVEGTFDGGAASVWDRGAAPLPPRGRPPGLAWREALAD